MAGFNLAEAIGLKKVSNLDTGELQEIGLDLIDPNPNNFFAVEEDITDLKESIELNGLLQPPVVTPSENGRYRLIAGHRRHKALKALWSENPEKYKMVMCRIVRPSSPALEELMLIQTNTEARELGWQEKIEAAERVEKILVKMQKNGTVLPGKMRSHVAKIIKASESQIARAKFIDKNLIEPLKKGSGLSDSAAYKLAHLPYEQQQTLYEHYKENPWMIDGTRIKTYQDNIANGRDPFYVEPPGPRDCYNRKVNEILGFGIAETPSPQGLPSWIPAAEISADLPDGYYSLLYLYKNAEICGMDDLPIVNYRMVFRKDGVWLSLPGNVKLNFFSGNERMIAAMAMPVPPEGYTLFLKQPECGEAFA